MIENHIRMESPFEFEMGGRIEGLEIVYHTSKPEYSGKEKVIWICHALTANSNPEDWCLSLSVLRSSSTPTGIS